MFFLHCLSHATNQSKFKVLWKFYNVTFLHWGLVSPMPTSKLENNPLPAVPQLLIQYIHSYPPYLEAFSSIHNLRMCHAVVTRDPPNMEPLTYGQRKYLISSKQNTIYLYELWLPYKKTHRVQTQKFCFFYILMYKGFNLYMHLNQYISNLEFHMLHGTTWIFWHVVSTLSAEIIGLIFLTKICNDFPQLLQGNSRIVSWSKIRWSHHQPSQVTIKNHLHSTGSSISLELIHKSGSQFELMILLITDQLTYKVCLWSSRNDFIASIPIHLQLNEMGHIKVLPLSSYVLSPMMLPPLETLLELILWNSFQCHHHIFLDVFNIMNGVSVPFWW